MTETPPSRKAAIIGFLIAGAVLLGLSLFAQRIRTAPAASVPVMEALTDSAPAGLPLQLRIVTPAHLSIGSMGWAAEGLHPHVLVDTTSIMAAPSDLRHVAADTFLWTLPALPAGTHILQLYWADMGHRAVGDSVRHEITITR
jgi:hypothetical protein